MNATAAILLMMHGLAHFVGFLGAWRLSPEVPYKSTVFAGRVDVGATGIKLVGLLWAFTGGAFMLASALALANVPGWSTFALASALASAAMCVTGWPDSKIGVWVNGILIALLLALRAVGLGTL